MINSYKYDIKRNEAYNLETSFEYIYTNFLSRLSINNMFIPIINFYTYNYL